MKEHIVSAAIVFENKGEVTTVTASGHADCILKAMKNRIFTFKTDYDEGFMTNEDKFVSRKEAYTIALNAKQIDPDDVIKKGVLCSPDMVKNEFYDV